MKTVEIDVKRALEGNPDMKLVNLYTPASRELPAPSSAPNGLKTGTTTVGATFKGGVILAADKRATMGAFIANKNAKKVNEITEHIWMTIAGGVADAQALIDIMRAECNLFQLKQDRKIPVKSAARLLTNILFRNKFTPYQVGLLFGGFTEDEGARLYDIGAYGSLLPEKYCSTGSGSTVALGVLETNWTEAMTNKACKKLCIDAVKAAMIRDIASGNGIDLVVVTADGSTFEHVPLPGKRK